MRSAIALVSVLGAVSVALGILPHPVELPPLHASAGTESLPRTLDECLVVLAKKTPAHTLEQMRRAPEADMVLYHHGLGTWMRNNWGLWARGPLYWHFYALGLEHPDDMSGVILDSFWRYLREEPLQVEEQVEKYQSYWRVAKQPDPSSNPQCLTSIEIVLGLHREFPDGSPRIIHMGKCCSDGQVWSYETDRGWYLPDEEQWAVWNEDPDDRCDPCRKPPCPYDEEGRRTRR